MNLVPNREERRTMMLRIRILPLLKRLGFKQDREDERFYRHKYDHYNAIIYKVNDEVRAMDMVKTIYVDEETIDHRENVLKKFPLDFEPYQQAFYEDWLQDMAMMFHNPLVTQNKDYYFGISEDRVVDDTYQPPNETSPQPGSS